MEKLAFSLVKALKYFRVYILHSHIISYVPNSMVKEILTHNGPNGNRGNWIFFILEYDLEIKPTKLIKGQGLAKLMAESNFHALDINLNNSLDNQEEHVTPQIDEVFLNSPWYADLIYILSNLNDPLVLTKRKAIFMKLRALKIFSIGNFLYRKDAGGILLKCMLKDDAKKLCSTLR